MNTFLDLALSDCYNQHEYRVIFLDGGRDETLGHIPKTHSLFVHRAKSGDTQTRIACADLEREPCPLCRASGEYYRYYSAMLSVLHEGQRKIISFTRSDTWPLKEYLITRPSLRGQEFLIWRTSKGVEFHRLGSTKVTEAPYDYSKVIPQYTVSQLLEKGYGIIKSSGNEV